MKKIVLILVGVIALIIGGLSFLFYQTIDEESYKEQIIASTRELLGREMLVKGPVAIKLFPSPVITISDIEIKNKTGFQSENLLTIDKIEAHIKFSSLFQNPLIVQNIILTRPNIYLEKNDKGIINWDLAFLKPENRLATKDDLLGQSFADLPPQFQNMEVKEGSLNYLNQLSQASVVLTEIKGKIKTQSIKGPFDFTGSVKVEKALLDTTLHVDKLGPDIETMFNLTMTGVNSKSVFSVQNGKIVKIAEPTQEIYGSFTFEIPKLSDFLIETKGFKELPPELDKEIIGNGQFRLASQSTKIEEIVARYGSSDTGTSLSGNLSFIYPTTAKEELKTNAVLRFSQLDIDTLLPYVKTLKDWEQTLFLMQTVLPNNLDFVVNVSRAVLFKQAITDLSLKATHKDKMLEILDLTATLPEKTNLNISGLLDSDAQSPAMNLAVNLKSTDLQPTLAWADIKLPLIENTAALHDIDASAEIRVNHKELSIDKIKTTIGDGQAIGNITVSLTEPVLTGLAKLQLASINFDNFVPYTAPTQERTFKEWLESVKTYLGNSNLLGNASFAFNITGNDITFKNLPIQKFTYDGKIEQSEWNTTQLRIDQIATANIRYSGIVSKNAEGSLSFKDIAFDVEMPKSMLLLDRMKIKSPFTSVVGKINTKGNLNGTFDKMNISAETSFSQGRVKIDGTIENILADTPKYELQTKITYPSFHQFIRLFDPVYKGLPNLTGAFAFDGKFTGTQNAFTLKETTTSIGAQKAQLDLSFEKNDGILSVKGSVFSPLFYLDKFIANKRSYSQVNTKTGQSQFSKELLDLSALDNLALDVLLETNKISLENWEMENFHTHILLNQKILALEDGSATIGEGKVVFSSLLNSSMATPFVKGQINIQNTPVRADLLTMGMFRLKNGNMSFTSNFNAKGNSIDDMMNSLSATGSFDIQKGTVSGLNLGAFERKIQTMVARSESFENAVGILNKEISVGETSFDSLSGSYAITNGLLRSSDIVLKAPAANAIIQMDFDIPNWKVSSSVALTMKDLVGYPSIPAVIKGSAHNPQTNFDLASFIKYIESSATDARNELLRQQKEKENNLRKTAAKGRTKQILDLTLTAEKQITQAEETLKLAPSETAQMELIRAKDAFALLQELTQKTVPSDADVEKASIQASMIETRTKTILTDVTGKASTVIKEKIAQNFTLAQEKMNAIHRIQKRLNGVEQIEQAYQKAFSTMTMLQQLNNFIERPIDLEKLQQAMQQSSEALDIMDLTYQSIAKFDVDAELPYEEETPAPTMQGTIHRVSNNEG